MDLFNFRLQYPVAKFLTLSNIASMMHQLLLGLDFIHKTGIIHRDIAPDNILVSCGRHNEPGGGYAIRIHRIVLSDYGQSRFALDDEKIGLETWIRSSYGAAEYTPNITPGTYLGKIHFRPLEGIGLLLSEYYDYSWDIWQLGMVLLLLISGSHSHPLVSKADIHQLKTVDKDNIMLDFIFKALDTPTRKELAELVFHYPMHNRNQNENNPSNHVSFFDNLMDWVVGLSTLPAGQAFHQLDQHLGGFTEEHRNFFKRRFERYQGILTTKLYFKPKRAISNYKDYDSIDCCRQTSLEQDTVLKNKIFFLF